MSEVSEESPFCVLHSYSIGPKLPKPQTLTGVAQNASELPSFLARGCNLALPARGVSTSVTLVLPLGLGLGSSNIAHHYKQPAWFLQNIAVAEHPQ